MRGMGSGEIRETYLRFFEGYGHTRVPSSPLVPRDDPTLLFTNAGMNQFKDVFTGQVRLPYTRATTAQKCVRAGGKHNDLDSVGRTPRHHTFFEMLGNFSFGDYFKREAIAYAWELVTRQFSLDPARLWITIYRDDDDAADLWRRAAGIPVERMVRLGEKDNFWAMGDTGPCGPSSELHYDRGDHLRCAAPVCGVGICDCPRWLEIWNLVFMQFERDAGGRLAPLPRPCIDTGMGLERMASILQGVASNFETDAFRPVIAAVEELSGCRYAPGESGFPFRVIADHARACSFLIADDVLPSNEGRGYVLRRILRRAARFGRRLGLDKPFLWRLPPAVAQGMGGAYPELQQRSEIVQSAIRAEEERFAETLSDGLGLLERAIAATEQRGGRHLAGETVFRLYDTYGFPLDLTLDVAQEHGLAVDVPGFERALEEQRQRARADRREHGVRYGTGSSAPGLDELPETTFLGYHTLSAVGEVQALFSASGAERLDAAGIGEEVLVVLDRTPFYGEGGGQVGDTGALRQGTPSAAPGTGQGGGEVEVEISDTRRAGQGVLLHVGRVARGRLAVGMAVRAEVAAARRRAVVRNHSATHLLHRALREILGDVVHQAGSLVAPDRLRFDFTWGAAIPPDRLAEIERLVNEHILEPLPVEWFVTGLEDARGMGAMALFGEKYGRRVRVVKMGDWSLELCGGIHVDNTSQIGLFHLVSETGIGSGIRRVEAVTGAGVLGALRTAEMRLAEAADVIRVRADELPARVRDLSARLAAREKALAVLQRQRAEAEADRLAAAAEEVAVPGGTVRMASGTVAASAVEDLRTLADDLRRRLGSGVVLVAAPSADRVVLLCAVTTDLVQRGLHAGKAVAVAAAAAGGRGGGRPDLAHAGIADAGRIPQAMAAGLAELRGQLAT